MSFPAQVLTIYSIIRIYASMKLEMLRMQSAADEASELLKALANRHRLLILCQLIDRERSVGELAEFLRIRDSTVSQHLALLRMAKSSGTRSAAPRHVRCCGRFIAPIAARRRLAPRRPAAGRSGPSDQEIEPDQ